MSRTGSNPTTEIIGTIKAQTARAILFSFEDDDGVARESWFPMSQIKSQEDTSDGTILTVTVWIMDQKKAEWK